MFSVCVCDVAIVACRKKHITLMTNGKEGNVTLITGRYSMNSKPI